MWSRWSKMAPYHGPSSIPPSAMPGDNLARCSISNLPCNFEPRKPASTSPSSKRSSPRKGDNFSSSRSASVILPPCHLGSQENCRVSTRPGSHQLKLDDASQVWDLLSERVEALVESWETCANTHG